MTKILLIIIFLVPVSLYLLKDLLVNISLQNAVGKPEANIPVYAPTPTFTLINAPQSKTLKNDYHIFQTFNNCGPAALSMALSYYGINKTQQELGNDLRPYQIPNGDNDDKSVTLEEMAEKSKEYGLIPYHRPNGNIDIVKQFIANDIPVITRTWLKENDDIGHFRIIKGYDVELKQIVQDDSLQGSNLTYSYNLFNTLWEKYNYEYLVLIPEDKQHIVENILGHDFDELKAWEKALRQAQRILEEDPADIYSRFNLSVAFYHAGNYQKSVDEFEKVENELPKRTLWYQIEPIQAYYKLGNYDRVLSITDKVLNNNNRAFSELYLLRGQMYLKQGNKETARREFEKAAFYNKNLIEAQEALASVQ